MKVVITQTAEASLEEIYRYKCEHSIAHVDDFFDEIYAFTINNLSEFPRLGHVHNEARGLFRLVYREGFDIYYTIGEQEVFVLFIIDSALNFNQELADPETHHLQK